MKIKKIPHYHGGLRYIEKGQVDELLKFWRDIPIKKIFAINAGMGNLEMALCKILFTNVRVDDIHFTDIIPPHDGIEKLNASDAIDKYGNCCDLMITAWPHYTSTGYRDIVRRFNGNYIMFIGAYDPEEYFIEQLEDWGDIQLDIPLKDIFDENIVVWKRKNS